MADTTDDKQRGRPFSPGQSGNPAGRPKGARNKATLAAEALMDGEAEELTRKAIQLAKEGDMTALRLCIERVIPVRRDRAISFVLPKIETVADATSAMGAVLGAVADGDLTPTEARGMAGLIDAFIKTLEMTELEKRIRTLEERR